MPDIIDLLTRHEPPSPPMRTITLDMLRAADACASHVALFVTTFGERADLTPENWARAIAVGLDVTWLERLVVDRDAHWSAVEALKATYWSAFEALLYTHLTYDGTAASKEKSTN